MFKLSSVKPSVKKKEESSKTEAKNVKKEEGAVMPRTLRGLKRSKTPSGPTAERKKQKLSPATKRSSNSKPKLAQNSVSRLTPATKKSKGKRAANSALSKVKVLTKSERKLDRLKNKIKKKITDKRAKFSEGKPRGVVYFSRLPHGFFERQLKLYCEQFGTVTNVYYPRSDQGNSRGYAFVEFLHPEVAQIVADTMNNYLMFKRLIKAKYIPPDEQRPWVFRFKGGSKEAVQKKKEEARAARERHLTEEEEGKAKRRVKASVRKANRRLKSYGVENGFQDPDSLAYEQHQEIIRDYIKFAKHARQQNIKFIELQFQDVEDASLSEPTYTKDEVEGIIQQLKELVCAEITAEFIAVSHTNVLLVVQLLGQAEKWHLRMEVDLSEIQNRERLEKVREMEDGGKTHPHRLQPILPSADGSDLLRMEIDRLQRENDALEGKVQELQTTIQTVAEEKAECTALSQSTLKDIDSLKKKLDDLELIANETKFEDENRSNFTEQLAKQTELCKQLSSDFEALKQEYLSTETKLHLAHQELNRKLNNSAAYNSLKKILLKKNEQVKELRRQLQKYQADSDDDSKEED